MNRAGRWIAALGLALAVALFVHDGVAEVAALVVSAGWGLVAAGLFHAVPMAINAHAWRVLFMRARRPTLATATLAIWVRESVNGLLPVARVGGEIAAYRLLVRSGGARTTVAATLVVDMAVSLLSQGVFAIAGVALLAARGAHDADLARLVVGALLLAIVGIVFATLQQAGLFERVVRLGNRVVAGRWEALASESARIDRRSRTIYRRRSRIVACFVWQLAGWCAGAGEIWLALVFLGHPASLVDAFVVESVVQAISSAAFVVPGALGVQEGGFLVVGALLGIDGPTSLALATARRLRDVVVFFPGLWAWHRDESRGAAAPIERDAEASSG